MEKICPKCGQPYWADCVPIAEQIKLKDSKKKKSKVK